MESDFKETPDTSGAFPRLTAEQISDLEPTGERRRVAAGDLLFKAGHRSYDFIVVLEGRVRILADHRCAGGAGLGTHGPNRLLGQPNRPRGPTACLTAR